MSRDFEFVNELVDAFFKKKKVRDTLKVIGNCDITGWENWFQIEFAVHLDSNEYVAEWYREESYLTDKRISKGKKRIAVDYLIRKKNHSKDSFIALELKQNINPGACINGMINDVKKISKVRGSEDNFRCLINIGIHSQVDEKLHKLDVQSRALRNEVKVIDGCLSIRNIRNTNYAYTVF